MPASEWVLVITTTLAVLTAAAAVIRDRKAPVLAQAQADGAIIDAEAVKAEVIRANRDLNVQRDLRILDLERWGDKMRYWVTAVMVRDDVLCRSIREDRAALNLPAPDFPPLPDPPEFPLPRTT
jgi:hypothetical protein